ncbi:MAG: hypothetical protein MI723_09945 [Caulobacterales bacterium]|nr:hypothetical protein [Caulobacterales bacterium]
MKTALFAIAACASAGYFGASEDHPLRADAASLHHHSISAIQIGAVVLHGDLRSFRGQLCDTAQRASIDCDRISRKWYRAGSDMRHTATQMHRSFNDHLRSLEIEA